MRGVRCWRHLKPACTTATASAATISASQIYLVSTAPRRFRDPTAIHSSPASKGSNEILSGMENTNLLPGAEYRVPVKASGPPVLTVVPAYPSYPPEMAYAPVSHTDEPAVVISEKGGSRRIYFPGDIERTAWRSGNTDVTRMLQNSIRWILHGNSPITVDGPGVVEIFAWETDPGFAVHILNYNNPNLHKGWIRRHNAIGPQTVRMDMPEGAKIPLEFSCCEPRNGRGI